MESLPTGTSLSGMSRSGPTDHVYDSSKIEREVLELIKPFDILIANPSNNYAALLRSLIRKHQELNVTNICQTLKHIQVSLSRQNEKLVLISMSHLLDGPIDDSIASLLYQRRSSRYYNRLGRRPPFQSHRLRLGQ